MTIKGKKIAVLVEQDYEDVELEKPLKAIKDAEAVVTIVGNEAGASYRGKRRQAEVTADAAAKDVNSGMFDGMVIPGGYAPDKMRLHQSMIDLARDVYQQGKLVAAICHGPQLLISAGIVKGKRMTSWPSVAIDLKNAGAEWVDEEVVKDGNLITSRRPDDLPAFSRAIIRYFD